MTQSPPIETFEIPARARRVPRTSDSPALRRLISIGIVASGVWALGALVQFQLARKVPAPGLYVSDTATKTNPAPEPEVRRAELVPMVKRALPVVGAHYPASLPDGQRIQTVWRGKVARFSDLPARPNIGDQFAVTEGPGHSWIWATPLGWNHPTWIDP